MPISSNIIDKIEALISNERNNTANMANISVHLMAEGGWHWVGFYIVDKENDQLVLGPFQGPVACTRLNRGNGVCAKSWVSNTTIVVPNVNEFEGHVACSSLSNSEVVIPVRHNESVVAVLDIDSVVFDGFTSEEVRLLERIINKLEERWIG